MIMSLVDMDTVKSGTDHSDFDFDRYVVPVENLKRNRMIERIQAILFAIPCIMFVLLLFLDFRRWEVSIICILPVAIAVAIDFLKDRKAEKEYNEYQEWLLEMQELNDD